ncbi:MAG TPA: hypothetical protein VD907_00055 [Verrucomicrobiae bacterium]|nr:hypothetical protein [Verrucomicrobiae bacterium]
MEKLRRLIPFTPSKPFVWTLIGVTLLGGIALRFIAMQFGHNFDFQSYTIVRDIMLSGGNVYAETARYNYGPVWFSLLGFFGWLATLFNNPEFFRLFIVAVLTLTDIGIALLLKKKFGLAAFVVFFLNPVSIVITGYHNQFDNLALLVGLLGLAIMPDDSVRQFQRRHVYAALLIGVSLCIKHLFFVLPLWLFIRGATLKIKLFMAGVPVAVFLLSFVPFWAEGQAGIMQNVFLYKSFANAPLLNIIFSPEFVRWIHPTVLVVAALAITGILTRRLPIFDAAMWYLLVLVAFSPAIANQYLAIAMPAVAGLGVLFFLPFIALAGLLLVVTSRNGLSIQRFIDNIPPDVVKYLTENARNGQYRLIILSLFLGMVATAIFLYKTHWLLAPIAAVKRFWREQIKTIKTKEDTS